MARTFDVCAKYTPVQADGNDMRRMWSCSVVGLALATLCALATAQTAQRSVAVISELGREIRVIYYEPQTGSRTANNRVDRLATSTRAFDRAALVAAQRAIVKADPAAKVLLVAPLDVDVFDLLQSAVVGTSVTIPADIAGDLKAQGQTHLLLFTRHRANILAKSFDGTNLATGQADGLGFYVDRTELIRNVTKGQSDVGFYAPFVHARAALIELASGKIVRTATMVFADPIPVAGTSLGTDDQLRILGKMLSDQVEASVPALLAPK
jgi:hypothetical protein